MKINKDVLQQAMDEIMDEDLRRIDKSLEEETLNQQIEAAQKRMNWEELYRKPQESDKRKSIRWQKAAAVFLILLIVSSSSVYALGKVWKAGVKWDVGYGPDGDTFFFEAENGPTETASSDTIQNETVSEAPPDEIEIYYEPAYIPGGYEECEEESIGVGARMADMVYVKKEEKGKMYSIIVSQFVLSAIVSIDSKDMERKTVDINGWKGQLNCRKNKIALIWATDEYIFTIQSYGNASEEELLKVARSLKPAKSKP